MSHAVSIVPFAPAHAPACAELIDGLPEWFGMPESNAGFLRDLGTAASWVVLRGDTVVGAITLKDALCESLEISFLAVRRPVHRCGLGRALVEHVEAHAAARGARWLHVWTLGPSHPDPHYARTRAFYAALGYEPLLETVRLWGPENPALVLVKRLEDPEESDG